VDETDEKAIKTGLFPGQPAYEGFLPQPQPGGDFSMSAVRTHAPRKFIGRGGARRGPRSWRNLFDPKLPHESTRLVFIGLTRKRLPRKFTQPQKSGLFNNLHGGVSIFSDPARERPSCARSAYLARKVISGLARRTKPFLMQRRPRGRQQGWH